MAFIDPRADTVVIRIVYDGPPMAGKTTSVRTLAGGLGGNVIVPEEINGRTVYFDWLDYTGGLFEGRQIRCQIVSVPGQAMLASRRRHLLKSADVVVFVGDSRRDELAATRQYLTGLDSVLRGIESPPVGIVMQANKRDHADAAELTEIRNLLDGIGLNVAIIESVATEGQGIREAFVFAVRLALDRVRELMRTGALADHAPSVDNADDLLAEMASIEGGTLNLAVQSGLKHTALKDIQASALAADAVASVLGSQSLRRETRRAGIESSVPDTPRGDLPSGMIWPPVDGRMILHDLASGAIRLAQDNQGSWSASIDGRWMLHSHATAQFRDLDDGRRVLVDWARLHAACTPQLSPQRCIALSADGHGQFRLWQVVGRETSLRDHIESSLTQGPEAIAAALTRAVDRMIRAATDWSSAPSRIPLSLRTTSATSAISVFIGRMPDPRTATPSEERPVSLVLRLLAHELAFAQPLIAVKSSEIVHALQQNASAADPASTDLAVRFVAQYAANTQ